MQKLSKKHVVGSKMYTKIGSKLASFTQNEKTMKVVPQRFSFSNSYQEMKSSENSHY